MTKDPTHENHQQIKEYYTSFSYEAVSDLEETDNVYAFTWNPDPNKYPSVKCRQQYKLLLRHCLLASYKCFSKFLFTPELTANGYVHIHGWFVLKDKYKYYKWFLPKCKQYGFVVVKNRAVNEQWYGQYVIKDIEMMNDILGDDLPIPLTHLNVRDYAFMYAKGRTIKYVKCTLPKNRSILDYIKK